MKTSIAALLRPGLAALVLILTFGTTPLRAEMLDITNAGFESLTLGDGAFVSTIPGWSNSGNSGTFNPRATDHPGEAPEGQNVAFSAVGGPTISQVLIDTLQTDTEYTLSILVGRRLNFPSFPGYQVQLLAGGIVIAEDNNSVSPVLGEFFESSVSYIATDSDPLLGQDLEIRFRAFGQQVSFDDVRLSATSTAVPEPGSMLLICAALPLMIVRRRRNRA